MIILYSLEYFNDVLQFLRVRTLAHVGEVDVVEGHAVFFDQRPVLVDCHSVHFRRRTAETSHRAARRSDRTKRTRRVSARRQRGVPCRQTGTVGLKNVHFRTAGAEFGIVFFFI